MSDRNELARASGPDNRDPREERRGPRSSGPFKRLIVCVDGTWLDSDNGMLNGELAIPSNVTRLTRAIKAESSDGIQQIVYYHQGLGSEGTPFNRFIGGTTGSGLTSDVREAYSFLSSNYTPGDEIFLFGFSRGAYTVRSVAGVISVVGLLTKKGLHFLPEVDRDVRHRRDRNYKPQNPDLPFPNKPNANDPAYREELWRRGLTNLDVTIKVVGVWDTVGSLGVPRIGWLTKVGLQSSESHEMIFHDTKLSNTIENAFQALALDERRSAFSPAIWEKPPGNKTVLRQVWFLGAHSNVGGGYDDQGLANITLAWMMSQLTPFLDMHLDYVLQQEDENIQYYRRGKRRIRPWSFGKLYDSMTGIYQFAGSTTRTPGTNYAVDQNCKSTGRPLRDTCEYIHPSVRTRIRLRGPGVDDRGRYDPESMDDWKLVIEYPDGVDPDGRGHGKPRVYWKARFSETEVSYRTLPESPLWDVERRLLALDEETEEYVMRPPPTKTRVEREVEYSRRTGAPPGDRRLERVERVVERRSIGGPPGDGKYEDRRAIGPPPRDDRYDGRYDARYDDRYDDRRR